MHRRDRIAALPLALVLLLAASAWPSPASASFFYALVGNSIDMGASTPRTVGPLSLSGGVGSTGTASAECNAGRMTTYGAVSCPVSGLFTPQIDAKCIDLASIEDIVCPELPADVATLFPLVLHTRLTGSLAISGAHPYAATVSVSVSTSTSVVTGLMTLSDQGLVTSGALAGAPANMSEYPVDFPISLYLASTPADFPDMVLETHAGGTAVGTEVNTATADFHDLGWELEPVGPVFSGLPDGVTVNIPSLNVYNNHWLGPIAGVAPGPRPGTLRLAARRNPFRGIGRFSLTLPADGEARVEVFDVGGARVTTLLDGWQAAGPRTLEWNTAAVRPGMFFVRAASGGREATVRVVVLP